MQATSGRPKKIRPTPTKLTRAPDQPAKLSNDQQKIWLELCSNPHLIDADRSLMHDYMNLHVLRDAAWLALTDQGTFIDDAKGSIKTHPSYKIWRDCEDRILKMRDQLLMTPKSRLQAAIPDEPEEEDETTFGGA